jgi:hypothetical protein
MGAYQTEFGFTTYEINGSQQVSDALPGIAPYGSYLVSGSVVPVPAAVWLFGSGLIALWGVARREKA